MIEKYFLLKNLFVSRNRAFFDVPKLVVVLPRSGARLVPGHSHARATHYVDMAKITVRKVISCKLTPTFSLCALNPPHAPISKPSLTAPPPLRLPGSCEG